jgi:hypothetical protein
MKNRVSSTGRHARWYAGISICESWQDFGKFREWAISAGYVDNLVLDRIDSTKGYAPDNCRWLTKEENGRQAMQKRYGGK